MIPESLKRRFENGELVNVVVQDNSGKEVLMVAWVNQEALENSIASGKATFWSRSRNQLWIKGESSGNFQDVISISVDCDRDAILLKVKSYGPTCHTGEQSCFHDSIENIRD